MKKKIRNHLSFLLALALLVFGMGTAWSAIDSLHAQKLLLSTGADYDEFGRSISISGDTAVMSVARRGVVYVYTRTANVWSQQAMLTAADGETQFGYDVAISGDTIVAGAAGGSGPHGGYWGSAYIFTRSAGVWSQQAKIYASDGANGDDFGWSVAASGDTVLIGATSDANENGSIAGSAYIFTRSGTIWSQQAKLIASNSGDFRLAQSVALDGDVAVLGSTSAPSTYVYTRSGAIWSEQIRLPAAGYVSISGDSIAVGSTADKSAYIYTGSGASWNHQATLTPAGGTIYSSFGGSISLFSDTLLVGDENDHAAYLYTRSDSAWSQGTRMTAPDGDGSSSYGGDVAVIDDTAMVGGRWDATIGSMTGAIYVHGPAYTVGGSISGLATDTSVTLQNNAGDNLTLSAGGDGSFTFNTPIGDGYGYNVTVSTQPVNPDQYCTVSDGSGLVAGANVSNVSVHCVIGYTIGGTASGLTAGSSVVLQNNADNNLTITADGSFVFTTLLANSSAYTVTILTQPLDPNLNCLISNGSGTVDDSNVDNVGLVCHTNLSVTSSANANGSISPSGVIANIPYGSSTGFLLTPGANYIPGPVTGTCPVGDTVNNDNGTWTYTSGVIVADCSVIANFEPGTPLISEGDSVAVFMDEDSAPTAFNLTLNATDPNNDPLSWSISSSSSKGIAEANGTGLSMAIGYTPNLNENGSDSFEVQVSDGEFTDRITVNVTINPVNDAPVFTSSKKMPHEDGEIDVGKVTASDVDDVDDDLVFALVGGADIAKFSLSIDGDLSFITPPDINNPTGAGPNGEYEIIVRVNDATTGLTEQAIIVLPDSCTFFTILGPNGKMAIICL